MRTLGHVAALLLACLSAGFAALPARAQIDDGAPPDYVAVKAYLDRDAYHAGDSAKLIVELRIDSKVHVNTPTPTEDYQFPTSIEWTDTAGLEISAVTWPKGAMKAFEFTEGKKIAVYEGTQRATMGVKIPAGVKVGALTLKGTVKAQGCTHSTCFAPQTDELEVLLRVVAAGEPTAAVNEEKFSALAAPATAADPAQVEVADGAAQEQVTIEPPSEPATTASQAESEAEPAAGSDELAPEAAPPSLGGPVGRVPAPEEQALQCPTAPAKGLGGSDKSLFWVYLLTFGSGIALAFTPCVLPLVPITIGFFSRQQQGGKRPVVPAMLYVLGIALVYSTLGTVAALSGGLFGSMLQNRWVVIGICAILFALALSMFGLWDMNLPPAITNRLGGGRSGNVGAMAMGGAMGLVAAPCVGPFVVSRLTYVAEMGSRVSTPAAALLGGSLFFALSVGMGLPFFLVALGAGSLRPGEWMVTVKKVFGFIILGVVLFFLRPLIGAPRFQWGLVLLLAAAAAYFLLHSRSTQHSARARTIIAAVGVLSMVACCVWAVFVLRSMSAGTVVEHAFDAYSDDALARAKADGRPVIIDFGAEWCIACKELEHQTFPDERVQSRMKEFVSLRADMTEDTPETEALYKRWGIRGLPTIVFLGSDGQEIRPLRLSEFEKPALFVQRLDCVSAIDVAER